jgi:hypothetical protein
MKKIVLLLVGAASLVVGGSAAGTRTAAAQSALTLSPSTVMAGTNFQAMLSGCSAGETIDFVIEETDLDPVSAVCASSGQTAMATLVAPTLGGSWTVRATGSASGITASAALTVTGGEEVPIESAVTGSHTVPIVLVGAGLLAVGAALASMARVGRSKANTVGLG